MSETDSFRIDSHKLHLHPQRVAQWLEGQDIAPLYMEVSPSGACNHRCRFCALDFMGYKARFLPLDSMRERFVEMGRMGLKAVMFAGEGEPFLHRQMVEMAEAAKAAGIDVAFTTNATLLSPEKARRVLPVTSWIKVSCNAGTAASYAQIHGTRPEDFTTVMHNMGEAVRLRTELGSACTLGFQTVLLPENSHDVLELGRRVRDIGADYLVIKPYSQHPQSHTREYGAMAAPAVPLESLRALETDSFRIIYRHEAVQRSAQTCKIYNRCLALPFWSYCDAGGTVWGCSMFLGKETFSYGSLLDQSFEALWHGKQRHDSLQWCAEHLDDSLCRVNCRMDPINTYLWELTNPGAHANFI